MAITRITKGVIKPNENYDTHNIVSTGIITSVGADINGDLDVDGHTNLDNVSISGVTTFAGSVNNLVLSGVVTTTGLDVNGNADISGNMSVGGVLTYEDVTSIDSVGIITARNDIHVGAGVSAVGVGTFGSLDIGGDIDVDGHTELDNLNVAGVTTFNDNVHLKLNDRLQFGNGNELEIYQQGNNSFILNNDDNFIIGQNGNGTAHPLRIYGGTTLELKHYYSNGGQQFLLNSVRGAQTEIYYAGVKKFETSSAGITVSGTVVATGADINGDIDVDGHTNLDNLSVAGVSTFSDDVTFTGASYNLTWDKSDNKLKFAEFSGIRLGNNNELQIDHRGTSYILNIDSMPLVIGSNSLLLTDASTTSNRINCAADGTVILYKSHSEKLRTKNYGIQVTGLTDTDSLLVSGISTLTGAITANGAIDLNADLDVDGHTNLDNVSIAGVTTVGSNLQLISSGDSDVNHTSSSNALRLRHNGQTKLSITSSSATFTTDVAATGNLTLTSTVTNETAGPEIKLYRNSSSPADADYLGQIKFAGESDTSVERNYAKITGKILDASNGTEDGILEFAHIKGGSQTITGRWRSDSLQLLNGTALTVAGSTTVTGNIIPSSDSATDIGTNSVRFANIYADTLYGDGSNLTGVTSVGGNTGVDFNDSVKARFGTGNDLELYHNGTDSWIVNNTGYLRINSDNIFIKDGDNDDLFIRCQHDAGVTLYYNNDRKFEILNTGAIVVGTLSATTFSGSGASLTNIPAAQLTGTLPAIDGSNLTGISISSDAQYNTVAGNASGDSITSGTFNSTFGDNAGTNITSGGYNTVVGSYALRNVSTQSNTTAIGAGALNNSTGSNNTIIGAVAGNQIVGSDNTGVGYKAIYGAGNSSGTKNIAIGNYTLEDLESGNYNTVVGYEAGKEITTGSNSTAIGFEAASSITSGKTTAVGYRASKSLTTGIWGVAVGMEAMLNATQADSCVAIGAKCLEALTTGDENTAVGARALYLATIAEENVAMGYDAGYAVTSGTGNTILGYKSGNSLTTGDNNIVIGHEAAASSATVDNEITLGDTNITKFRIPGINVTLKDNGGTPTQGHVLTVDGNGEAGFAAASGTTINNNANNRVITGSGTANTLEAESNFTYDGTTLQLQNSGSGLRELLRLKNSNASAGVSGIFFNSTTSGTAFDAACVRNGVNGSGQGRLFLQTNNGSGLVTNLEVEYDGQVTIANNSLNISDSIVHYGDTNTKIRFPAADTFTVETAGTERFRIASDGAILVSNSTGIGIGAATNGSSSYPSVTISGTSGGAIHFEDDGDLLADIYGSSSGLTFSTRKVNDVIKFQTNSGLVTEKLRIDSVGDVFIGRTGGLSDAKLSIQCDTGEAAIAAQMNTSSSTASNLLMAYNSGGVNIANISCVTTATPDLTFNLWNGSSTAQKMRLTSGGAVEIGTGTGSGGGGLAIYGGTVNNVSGQDAALYVRHDSNADWGILLQKAHEYGMRISSNSSATLSLAIYDQSNNLKHQFKGNGDYVASGAIDSTSDIKLKTNIKTIDNALDKVLQLRGAEYDRIDKDNQHEIGVIAQEVEEVIPELVHGDETKTVSYGNMVAVLIEAIKEQNEVINKMKKEIEDLKG